MSWEEIAESRLKACNEYSAEIDRLRAENAELRYALECLLNLQPGCREWADAILARTTQKELE